jgi:hypothetical protein
LCLNSHLNRTGKKRHEHMVGFSWYPFTRATEASWLYLLVATPTMVSYENLIIFKSWKALEFCVRQWPVVAPSLDTIPSVPWALPSTRAEVVWCVGGRIIAYPERTVALMLELSWALPFGCYCPLLELVDGSEVSPSDWSV